MIEGFRRQLAAFKPPHMDRISELRRGAEKMQPCGRHLLRLLAGATLAFAALVLSPAFLGDSAQAQRLVSLSAQKRLTTITVSVGKSEDVRLDTGFGDVLIGDAEIADINPLTDKTLSILGKKLGTTRVSVYGEGKRLVGVFDIEVSYDTTLLQDELKRRFPYAKMRVSAVNGRLMLTGTAPDGATLDKAVQIARQFGPEVISSVAVDAPQQVMLEVRFVEVARTAGRDLGVQWNARSDNKRFLANVGDGGSAILPWTSSLFNTAAAGVLGTTTSPFGVIGANLIAKGMNIDVVVNALEERGLARKLAEPNLVALSGDTASFLAGGEFPIPLAGTLGQTSVDYKKFGVSLAFTPTVLGGGLINMKVEPEVSQLDPANQVTLPGGAVIPGLTVRRASTTLELRDGQSFVLAGLLQANSKTLQQQLPWIGDVPVLGTLFSSKSYQRDETDLVIIVTPRLVRPIRPGEPVATPLDDTLPSNDVDFFLANKPELRRADVRATEGPPVLPFTGHMLDFAKGGTHAALQ